MDTILGVLLLFGMLLVGCGIVYKSIDGRYPKRKIFIIEGNIFYTRWFRIRGERSIVKDDLIAILMNRFTYFGDLDQLQSYMQTNGQKVYIAVIRHNYLIGTKTADNDKVDMIDKKPVVIMPKGEFLVNGQISLGEYMLNPIMIKYVNDTMTERTVRTGKDIAVGFIEAEEASKAYNMTTNPLMAALIGSIPLLIIGAMCCLMIYVGYMSLNDNVVKMLDAASQIAASVARMNGG